METTITKQNRELSTRVINKKQIFMKKFYLLAAAVTALTACTNNEKITADLDNDGQVLIGFETYHEKSTKATGEITAPNHLTTYNGGFGVWGYKAATAPIADGTPEIVNVSSTTTYTEIFNNVKVWYNNTVEYGSEPVKNHYHFTYAIPKYWDKGSEYIFFAYAPYHATNATLDKNKGTIAISNIPALQDISAKNSGTGDGLVYSGTEGKTVVDYLMATYVTGEKYNATNEKSLGYNDAAQTVGFTFGHMLSKLQINLEAFEAYGGVKEILVNSFSIENMPNKSSDAVTFTQTSPTGPAGTYSKVRYDGEVMNIIGGTPTTSSSPLYVLKGGVAKNASGEEITTESEDKVITSYGAPTGQAQQFNFYAAPNNPDNTESDDKEPYLININYTINYVDGASETVNVEDVDLSSLLEEMQQNNSYILTIKIKLHEILFTVKTITNWDETSSAGWIDSENNLIVEID